MRERGELHVEVLMEEREVDGGEGEGRDEG